MKKTILLLPIVSLMIIYFMTKCGSTQRSTANKQLLPDTIITNLGSNGNHLIITFKKGKAHNHPLMAIWIEDTTGQFIQTLYVAESIGKGTFNHGKVQSGRWEPGPVRRPAALPYWSHQRGIQAQDGLYTPAPENPVIDAYTGPTPQGNFLLKTKTNKDMDQPFKLLFEINQAWDWNDYWTTNKHPNDKDYKTSGQPSIIYSVVINPNQPKNNYNLKAIGHSHYAGRTGKLYKDLSNISSALNITERITVEIKQ